MQILTIQLALINSETLQKTIEMNTNKLRYVMTRDSRIREKLIDVFALDQFKEFVKKNKLVEGLYVCNDQIMKMTGNHWFIIYVEKNLVNFIDSFAKDPSYCNVKNEINMKTEILKVPFQLQSIFSDVCGEFAIYFAFHLCRKKPLNEILMKFSKTNHKINDECVRKFVHKTFPGHTRL